MFIITEPLLIGKVDTIAVYLGSGVEPPLKQSITKKGVTGVTRIVGQKIYSKFFGGIRLTTIPLQPKDSPFDFLHDYSSELCVLSELSVVSESC